MGLTADSVTNSKTVLRLSCFADVAVDLAHVTTPFLIATDGELTLRFADVRLESAAEGEVPCP